MATSYTKTCARGWTALILALATCCVGEAHERGYLALIGPTPLRFTAPPNRGEMAVLPPLLTSDNDTGSARVASSASKARQGSEPIMMLNQPAESAVGPTLSGVLSPLWLTVFGDGNLSQIIPAHSMDGVTNAISAVGSADDLLIVNPQMLMSYFKTGGKHSTNSVNPTVVVPITFMPPGATTATPASSQAVYRSQ